MRYLILGLLCFAMSGCHYDIRSTPAEAEAQKSRMRYYLDETSPRNSSNHPKVTPEFKKSYGSRSNLDSRDLPHTKQSEDDVENW